jgi:replicative DNA helicase
MSVIDNYSLEKTLTDYKVLKQNFKTLFEEKNVRFCGIDTVDNILNGFHKDKTYYFVANEGMGAFSFIGSIFENFNFLYDEKYRVDRGLGYIEYIGNGDTLMKSIGSKFQFLELSLDVTVREHHNKRPTLEDIPKHIQQKSDVIISIYRPEYYNLETWEDGSSTENQIEFSILQNFKRIFSDDKNIPHESAKLFFDKENKKVSSIRNSSLSENWTNRMRKLLHEETN